MFWIFAFTACLYRFSPVHAIETNRGQTLPADPLVDRSDSRHRNPPAINDQLPGIIECFKLRPFGYNEDSIAFEYLISDEA